MEEQSEEEAEPDADLTNMTKAELLEYANENGIEGVDGRMNKATIIEKIENTETELEEPSEGTE